MTENNSWLEISHRSTIEYALLGIKSLCISCGGAILVTVGFIGNIWNVRGSSELIDKLELSLFLFTIAMSCSLSISFFSYLSQGYYTHLEDGKGKFHQNIAIAFAIFGIIFFASGCISAYFAFI